MACLRVAPLVIVAALIALAGSAASTKYKVYWCSTLACSNCQTIQVQSENTCTAPGMSNVPPGLIVVPRNNTFVTLKFYKASTCDEASLADTESLFLSDNGNWNCIGTGTAGQQVSTYVQTGFARALAASPLTLALASLLALLAMALMT